MTTERIRLNTVRTIHTKHTRPFGSRGIVTTTAGWFCVVFALAPVVTTILAATATDWNKGPFGDGVTVKWMIGALPSFLPGLSMTLYAAGYALVINLIIGVPLAWLIARTGARVIGVIRWVTGLPLAVPGIAIGLAIIGAFPQVQRSGWLLIVGHVLATLPFLIAAVVPALADKELIGLESTASTLGARFFRRFFTVTLPHIRTSLLSAALMMLTVSVGEFNITYFIVNPAQQTLPVALFSSFLYEPISAGAALTLWYCITVIPLAVGLELLGNLTTRKKK